MSHIALRLADAACVQIDNVISSRNSEVYCAARVLRISKITLGIAYRELAVRREHKVAHTSQREVQPARFLGCCVIAAVFFESEGVPYDVKKPPRSVSIQLSVVCVDNIIRRSDVTIDMSTAVHCLNGIEREQMEVTCYAQWVTRIPHGLFIRRIDDRQSVSGILGIN